MEIYLLSKCQITQICLFLNFFLSLIYTACQKPKVKHGFIVGPYNNTLYYTCDEDYKLMAKGWWGVTTCGSDGPVAECIGKKYSYICFTC